MKLSVPYESWQFKRIPVFHTNPHTPNESRDSTSILQRSIMNPKPFQSNPSPPPLLPPLPPSLLPPPPTPPPGDGSVQLVGGRDRCQGRVEVYYRGSWGTVCDDDWDQKNAEVVCRQIQCGRAVSALRNAYFGYGRGEILLDNVNCTGNELMLSRCYSLGWGTNNCGHAEDVGVVCSGSAAVQHIFAFAFLI